MQNCCVIIPCYREGRRLDKDAFLSFLGQTEKISFCFVNDGSPDNTLEVLNTLSALDKRIYVIDLGVNKGKAEAVRAGMMKMSDNPEFAFLGFWDADLATPLSEVPRFLDSMEKNKPDMVIGSRWKRMGAVIDRKASRHYLGRIFSTLASVILGLPVYDSQCGAKMFRRSVIPSLFSDPFLSKWLFDVEILARFRNHYGKKTALEKILELPLLSWREVGASTLRFSYYFRVPFELLRIRNRYKKPGV